MSQATYSFVHSSNCTDPHCKGFCQNPIQQPSYTFPKPPFSYEKHEYEKWDNNYNCNDYINYRTCQMNYVPPDKNVPYLLLPARLSLIWVNKWTIALILIFIRLLFFLISFKKDMNTTQERLQDMYMYIQHSANALVLIPQSVAIGTNKMIALQIENSVKALSKTLILMLVGVENIILFFIEIIIHTWTCLLELTIKGGITIVADVVEKVSSYVSSALESIEKDVVSGIKEINNGLLAILNTIEKTSKILGKRIKVPNLSISDVEKISNLSIPKNYDNELRILQNKISLDPLKHATENAIRLPFFSLTKHINNAFSNYSFNTSLLPVPPVKEFEVYPDNQKMEIILKKLSNSVYSTIHIMLIVLVILAILAIVPSAIKEWWDWRRLQSKASMVWSIFSITKTFDPTEFILTITHPWPTLLGVKFSQSFQTQHRKTLARWFLSYIFHPSSLFVLMLGVLGFIGCGLQIVLLYIMKKNISFSLLEMDVDSIIAQNFKNTSHTWSNNVNLVLDQTNTNINKLLFSWVHRSTQSVNNTLDIFIDTTVSNLKNIFEGTILYQPILDVLNCMFLIKLKAIEKGLTWVHQNARVSFPFVPNDIISSTANSSIIHKNLENATKNINRKFYSILISIMDDYKKSIILEGKISLALVSAWVMIFIMGLLRVIFTQKSPLRGMGGGAYVNISPNTISLPILREENSYDYIQSKAQQYNVNSFKDNKEYPSDFNKGSLVDDDISTFTKSNSPDMIQEQSKWKNDKK